MLALTLSSFSDNPFEDKLNHLINEGMHIFDK